MDPIRFTGRVRYWNEEKGAGLAVVDVPPEHHGALGGLKQQRVRGTIGGREFASNVAPAGKGRLALSTSKQMLASAGLNVGDPAEVEITAVGRE